MLALWCGQVAVGQIQIANPAQVEQNRGLNGFWKSTGAESASGQPSLTVQDPGQIPESRSVFGQTPAGLTSADKMVKNSAADNPATNPIAAWDFFGAPPSAAVHTATVFDVNLNSPNLITRGPGAPGSTGDNSFRTKGFQNNGISVNNTDYFEITLGASPGFKVSLSTIDARFAGTETYYATPGVTSQFAYSLGGSGFTLIGNPVTSSGLIMGQIDLTQVAGLQNVAAGTVITLRYYASGQTTTGGWGFHSSAAGIYGLSVGGSVSSLNLTAPVLALPQVSTVTTVSAFLGATISSAGGSPILGRGTVWNTTGNVTIADNNLAEGGSSTGVFSHLRTLLPAETQIFFKGYASNAQGTSLSSESSFFTLAEEPGNHASNFTATASGSFSVDLAWTPATGADGYLVVQKQGAAPASGMPADATAYPTGAAMTDGTVAAVISNGLATFQTITALQSSTQYSFTIFPFAWDNLHPQTYNYLTSSPVPWATATTQVSNLETYLWNQTTPGDYTIASNWTPSRLNPQPTDQLIFSNGGSCTVTNVPSQTVGMISVSNNTQVSFESMATASLSLSGGGGPGLEVMTGSSFILGGTFPITITALTGTAAEISGTFTFATPSNTAHRLTGTDPGSVRFKQGSVFSTGSHASGNPFGTTSTGSVVFEAGSRFLHQSGNNPFGATQPSSVVVFQPGSLYKILAGVTPSFAGRTYADFELDAPGVTITGSGTSPVSIDQLTIRNGTLNFNVTGSAGHAIKGNITVMSGATLNLSPAAAGTVRLAGALSQSITCNGNFFTTSNSTIEIANSNGVSLNSSIVLNGNLKLTSGLVTLGDYNLTLGAVSAITGTPSASAMVVATGAGKLRKNFASPGTFTFTVGDNTGIAEYSPVVLDITSGTFESGNWAGAGVVNAKYPGDPNTSAYLNRYWDITTNAIANLTCNLLMQYHEADVSGAESQISCIRVEPVPFMAYNPANTLLHQLTATGLQNGGIFTGSGIIPDVYAVSGTGTYCAGSTGLPVTLSGSQISVSYQLLKGGIPAGAAVSGTGSALTWSDQDEGIYTVNASNNFGSTPMNGSAVITLQSSVTPAISIVTTDNHVCSGTAVTLTANIQNGGSNPMYRWKINGINTGSSTSTFTYIPTTTDGITCELTSALQCVTVNPAISNTVTITVDPVMPVSVTISTPQSTLCAGTPVTFTAAPVNGGSTPVFQWLVNNSNAGLNSPTFTYPPVNNDEVSCIVSSSLECVVCNPALSNPVGMTVLTMQPVSIAVSASANSGCEGTSVTYTATSSTAGTSPLYAWNVNGTATGSNSPEFSYYPADGDIVTCRLTSGLSCVTGNPATSNPVVMTVNPQLPTGLTITESANHICTGTPVTFEAVAVNGGDAASFQWKVNNADAGSNSSTFTYFPQDGDIVFCLMTSSVACPSENPAWSNAIVMSVNDQRPVTVTISGPAGTLCAGSSATFTATGINGGSLPQFQWLVNGTATGINSSTFTYLPASSDEVTCLLTSNLICATGNPALSNSLTVTVDPILPAGVTIAASSNPVSAGSPVSFTATPVNGGVFPSYQWMINGISTGTNSALYTCIPINNDVITCMMTSSGACITGNPALSNSVVMNVNCNAPMFMSAAGIIGRGTDTVFQATQSVTSAGGATMLHVGDGGRAYMRAGHTIRYLPGTVVASGGYLHGTISTALANCGTLQPAAVTVSDENHGQSAGAGCRIWPNPTEGRFTLEYSVNPLTGSDGRPTEGQRYAGEDYGEVLTPPYGDDPAWSRISISIFDLRGIRLQEHSLDSGKPVEFDISDLPPGMYYLQIREKARTRTLKLIKH